MQGDNLFPTALVYEVAGRQQIETFKIVLSKRSLVMVFSFSMGRCHLCWWKSLCQCSVSNHARNLSGGDVIRLKMSIDKW